MLVLHSLLCVIFFKDEQGSPNEVLQRLLESDQFAGISSRITSRGTQLVVCNLM